MSLPGRLLSEHTGVVCLPLSRAAEIMLTVPLGTVRGDNVPLVIGGESGGVVTISGGPSTFTTAGDHQLTIDVDPDAGWIQSRGQWWYCGRLQLAEHPDGTLVTQQTYNCAKGVSGRIVPFTVGRQHRQSGEQVLTRVLRAFAERFGARTYRP